MRQDLLALIKKHADELLCPLQYNPIALLCAICMNESSFGTDNQPRFEESYYIGGHWYNKSPDVRKAVMEYKKDAACSWGVMQIMFTTARELGFTGTPKNLEDDEVNIIWAIKYINARVYKRKPQATLSDVFDAYNSGSCLDLHIPERYVLKGMENYSYWINELGKVR